MTDLIDRHTHLEEMEGLSEAIARGEDSKVTTIITMGSDKSSKRALDITGTYGHTPVFPALRDTPM